jgi:hypothetical protein
MMSDTLCKKCQKKIIKRKKSTGYCKHCWFLSPKYIVRLRKIGQEMGKKSYLIKLWATEHKGIKHPRWKGGKRIDTSGYVYLWMPHHHSIANSVKRYVPEHRIVMEKHLKRELLKREVVHHINGNKLDNRIENLIVLSQSEHIKRHHSENKNWKTKRGKDGKFIISP